ncbi:ABC transporter substrate-binding protein [Eubacteriales bacterium OttesenSCG-928-A19]|nr:ABC transporter substrate-binding protein [Eubacteriales bacterium OttesenSCG-928-A19]
MKKRTLATLLALLLCLSLGATALAGDVTPKAGGTLRVGTSTTPTVIGYTPEVTQNVQIVFLRTAYESLLFYDEDGALIPQLADTWSVDPDAATITFTLVPDVKFSDGTDFNAEAVKWNLEQYQAKGRTEVGAIDTIECPDDLTVLISLKAWNSSALESIGFFVYYMSPTAVTENGEDWARQNTSGTGPFVLTEWNQGVSVKYERNPNYRVAGQPYLDGITFTTITETSTTENALRNGELDMVHNAAVDVIRSVEPEGTFIITRNQNGVGLEMTGLIPSSDDPDDPFYDARVRQAMCYGFDADTVVSVLGYGYYSRTNQWAAPGASTYNPDVQGYEYNPEKAKELLAEAGYADGFDTTFWGPAGMENWMVAIAGQLEEIGIRAKIELIDGAKQGDLMANGWDGLFFHWASISPDLGLYMGRHLDVNGAYYAAGIQHPDDCMELLEQIRTAKDDETKQAYSWELQKLIYDEYALFGEPLYITLLAAIKYPYVMDDNLTVFASAAWTPAQTWLDK